MDKARGANVVAPANANDIDDAAMFGLRTIELEAAALRALAQATDTLGPRAEFNRVVDLVLHATGRVVVTGMGKSGLIGRKIAATLSSTGTRAFFIHPADAGHGDLGMIAADDVVLALSWSGETGELSPLVAHCRRSGIPLLAVTSAPGSTLAVQSSHVLLLPEVEEACPNRLAPTSSTAMQLAIGDALAVALMNLRGFSPRDFYALHPKGNLAARFMIIEDVMASGHALPRIQESASIMDAITEMSQKRFGVTAVTDGDGRLLGVFTDGDLRRSVAAVPIDEPITGRFSRHPITADRAMPVKEAMALMNRHNISQLIVVESGTLLGIVHLHDLLRVGAA